LVVVEVGQQFFVTTDMPGAPTSAARFVLNVVLNFTYRNGTISAIGVSTFTTPPIEAFTSRHTGCLDYALVSTPSLDKLDVALIQHGRFFKALKLTHRVTHFVSPY